MDELLLAQFPADWGRGPIRPRCSVPPWVKDWATLAQCRGPPTPTDVTFPTRVPFLLIAGISILQEHADGMSQLKVGDGEGLRSARLRSSQSLPTPARQRPQPNAAKPLHPVGRRRVEIVVKQPLRSDPETSRPLLSPRAWGPHRLVGRRPRRAA